MQTHPIEPSQPALSATRGASLPAGEVEVGAAPSKEQAKRPGRIGERKPGWATIGHRASGGSHQTAPTGGLVSAVRAPAADTDQWSARSSCKTADAEAATALRLGGALWRFWLLQGHLSEGRQWLEKVLAIGVPQAGCLASTESGALTTQVPSAVRAKALNGAGVLAHYQGDSRQAKVLCEESLALFRAGSLSGIDASMGVVCQAHLLILFPLWQKTYRMRTPGRRRHG